MNTRSVNLTSTRARYAAWKMLGYVPRNVYAYTPLLREFNTIHYLAVLVGGDLITDQLNERYRELHVVLEEVFPAYPRAIMV